MSIITFQARSRSWIIVNTNRQSYSICLPTNEFTISNKLQFSERNNSINLNIGRLLELRPDSGRYNNISTDSGLYNNTSGHLETDCSAIYRAVF